MKNRFAYPADNFTTTSNQGLGRWVLQNKKSASTSSWDQDC